MYTLTSLQNNHSKPCMSNWYHAVAIATLTEDMYRKANLGKLAGPVAS